MARMLSPDDACRGVDVPSGRRYSGQAIEVTDLSDFRVLKQAGYTVAGTGGTPLRSAGFECSDCGFQSFFRLCSRCGATCERPDLAA